MNTQHFGKYEIVGSIARGGMATVCLARSPGENGLPKAVSLKMLRPEFRDVEEMTLMLADEADIALRLDHPNCIRTFEAGAEYLSMEYVVGETLDLLLRLAMKRATPLFPEAVAGIIGTVCDALHYAHDLRGEEQALEMIHRDVSPENIMISDRGAVKLLDFGVAKARQRRQVTSTGIVKGKFSYMSPEQMSGKPIDRRCDIYALGVTLYSCLTNRRPFDGLELEALFEAKIEGSLPPASSIASGLDERLSKIADKAMARRPQDRFATAAEMGAALRELVPAEAAEQLALMLLTAMISNAVAKKRDAFERLLKGELTPEVLTGLRLRPVEPKDLPPFSGNRTPVRPKNEAPAHAAPHLEDSTQLDPMPSESFDEPSAITGELDTDDVDGTDDIDELAIVEDMEEDTSFTPLWSVNDGPTIADQNFEPELEIPRLSDSVPGPPVSLADPLPDITSDDLTENTDGRALPAVVPQALGLGPIVPRASSGSVRPPLEKSDSGPLVGSDNASLVGSNSGSFGELMVRPVLPPDPAEETHSDLSPAARGPSIAAAVQPAPPARSGVRPMVIFVLGLLLGFLLGVVARDLQLIVP